MCYQTSQSLPGGLITCYQISRTLPTSYIYIYKCSSMECRLCQNYFIVEFNKFLGGLANSQGI